MIEAPKMSKDHPYLTAENVDFLADALTELGFPIPTVTIILQHLDRKQAAIEAAKAEKAEAERNPLVAHSKAEFKAKTAALQARLDAAADEPEAIAREAKRLAAEYGGVRH